MIGFWKRNRQRKASRTQHTGSPLIGFLDSYDGNELRGWAGYHGKREPVDLVITVNGKEYRRVVANAFRLDLKTAGFNGGFAAFRQSLNIDDVIKAFGGGASLGIHALETGEELRHCPISIAPPNLKWEITESSDELFAGWIADENNPQHQLMLSVLVNGVVAAEIPAKQQSQKLFCNGKPMSCQTFRIEWATLIPQTEICNVSVQVVYGKRYWLCQNKEVFPFHGKLKQLTELQTWLRDMDFGDQAPEKEKLITSILPGIIDACRKQGEVPSAITPDKGAERSRTRNSVCIVVPVYKGIEETINCLQSVVASENTIPYRLIVIDDCSPEPEMQTALNELSQSFHFELYRNDINLGFVGTINRGISLASGHDVILLNSDTIVPDGWLDALHDVAQSSKTIGTVTPFSNNATICSFPRICEENELPNGFDVHDVAQLCAQNAEPPVEIPTAIGFCMYIKCETLSEVGLFDAQRWGKGYAEENDFSMRASRLGWRHVVTNKTFVQHLGRVSFANDADCLLNDNLTRLFALYPDYASLVSDFIRRDPVRHLRNELAQKVCTAEIAHTSPVKNASGKSMLFVSHSIGGGTQVAIRNLAEFLSREKQHVFILSTKDNVIWNVTSYQSNTVVQFNIEEEWDELIAFLRALDVWTVQYHHVLQFGKEIWNLPRHLDCKYDVTLHDYFSVCPRVNMVTDSKLFCGEPNVEGCRECLMKAGVHDESYLQLADFDNDITEWRSFFYEKLLGARKVITPSNDSKRRIEKYMRLPNLDSRYHPEPIETVHVRRQQKRMDAEINIGFIGAIGHHKGMAVVKGLANEIEKQGLNVKITVVGYTSEDGYLESFDFVKITGPYQQADLASILSESKIDVIFLASIWPETYGYTYSEVVRLGYPVASFSHGAVVERMRNDNFGLVLTPGDSYTELLSQLRKYATRAQNATVTIGDDYKNSLLTNYYQFENVRRTQSTANVVPLQFDKRQNKMRSGTFHK